MLFFIGLLLLSMSAMAAFVWICFMVPSIPLVLLALGALFLVFDFAKFLWRRS